MIKICVFTYVMNMWEQLMFNIVVWLCCIVVGKGVNRSSVLHVYFIAD